MEPDQVDAMMEQAKKTMEPNRAVEIMQQGFV